MKNPIVASSSPLSQNVDSIRRLEDAGVAAVRNVNSIAPKALAAFRSYDWPGNVRELRNVIERAMILEDGDTITTKYLPRGLTTDSRQGSDARVDAAGQTSFPSRKRGSR